jgi:hypothetical protein
MNKITEKDLIPASKYLSNDAPVPENFVPAQEFLSKEEFNIPENFVPAQNFLSGDYTLPEKKKVSDRLATKLDFVEEPELDTSTHQPQFPQSQEFKETVEKQDIGKSESIPGFEYNKEEYPYGIPIPGARKIGFGTERVVEGLDTTAALVTGGLTGAIGTGIGVAESLGRMAFADLTKHTPQEVIADAWSEGFETQAWVMNNFTYMPRYVDGAKVVEAVSWPFTKAHEKIDEKAAKNNWSEEKTEAVHLAADTAFFAIPMATPRLRVLGSSAIKKIRENKTNTLIPEEIGALREIGEGWKDLIAIENVENSARHRINRVVKESEDTTNQVSKATDGEIIDADLAILDEADISPKSSVTPATWKQGLTGGIYTSSDGFSARKVNSKKWQLLDADGNVIDTVPTLTAAKALHERNRGSSKRVKVDVDEAVVDHEFYMSKEQTAKEAVDLNRIEELVESGKYKNTINNVDSNQVRKIRIVNNLNRALHGDKNIKLTEVLSDIRREIMEVSERMSSATATEKLAYENYARFLKSAVEYWGLVKTKSYKELRVESAIAKDSSVTTYSNLDPTLIGKLVAGLFKKDPDYRRVKDPATQQVLAYADKSRNPRASRAERIKQAEMEVMSKWWDARAKALDLLDRHGSEKAHAVHRRYSLSQGANTLANEMISNMRKSVYGKMSRADRKWIDVVMFLRRVVAIDEARESGGAKPVNHPNISKQAMQRLGLEGKPIKMNREVALDVLEKIKTTLGEDRFSTIDARASVGFDTMRDVLTMLKDEGIITEKAYETLKGADYLKRKDLMQIIDPERQVKIGSKTLTVGESGLTGLKKGTAEDILEMDSSALMADSITRATQRIFRNRANVELFEFAKDFPDNGFARIPELNDKGKLPKPARGWERIDVYVDGKKTQVDISNKFAEGWFSLAREVSYEQLRFWRLASGSELLKYTATGANPEFALPNLLRDAIHIYLSAQMKIGNKWKSVYSNNLPMFTAQYLGDMRKVASDTVYREGRWIDAIMDGMGMEFLAMDDNIATKINKLSDEVADISNLLKYINTSSEIVSRLAIREAVLRAKAKELGITIEQIEEVSKLTRKKFGVPQEITAKSLGIDKELFDKVMEARLEASFAARDYMDFNNKGTYAAAIDAFSPYFGARIQASRGLLRASRRNPKEAAYKLANLAGLVTGMKLFNTWINPDGEDLVPEEIRNRNFVIMTGIKYQDENDATRHVYFTIPKDTGAILVSRPLDYLMDKYFLGKENVKPPSIADLGSTISPIDSPWVNVPTGNAIAAVFGNLDINKTLERGNPVRIYEGPKLPEDSREWEINEDTPPWAVALGQVMKSNTGLALSPAKTQAAVNSFFANSMWSVIGSAGANKAVKFSDLIDQDLFISEALLPETPVGKAAAITSKAPILRRFIRVTPPESGRQVESEMDIQDEESLMRHMLNIKMYNKIMNHLNDKDSGPENIAKMILWANSYPEHSERLIDQLEIAQKLKKYGGNDSRFFTRLLKPNPIRTKAEIYYDRWSKLGPKERRELDKAKIMLGFDTPNFEDALTQVITKNRMQRDAETKSKTVIEQIFGVESNEDDT